LCLCGETLSKEEGQDDQYDDEKTSQRADGFQVFFDIAVIGVEFVPYLGGWRRAPADLSFAFICHYFSFLFQGREAFAATLEL
jgi:hypothetical protein